MTGAGGFVGPYLARYLIDQDAIVYGLVRRPMQDLPGQTVTGVRNTSGMDQIVGDLDDPKA